MYEEVIPRGNRTERIVSGSVWRWLVWFQGGGGAQGLRKLMVCVASQETLRKNYGLKEND